MPPEWRFDKYSLSEFKEVSYGLLSLAHYHSLAYGYSIIHSGPDGGFINNLFKFTMVEMINRLSRYTTDVEKTKIEHILIDLTYGSHDLDKPDPALQPIIQITDKHFVIVPSIVISNSPERNLIALFNRIPENKKFIQKSVMKKNLS